jgi:hypothetical protein
METIQIEIKNKNALSILRSLEKAKIIKLIGTNKAADSVVQHKGVFTRDRALEMIRNIETSREEWDETQWQSTL